MGCGHGRGRGRRLAAGVGVMLVGGGVGWGREWGGRGGRGLTQARREVRSERMCEICMVAKVRVGLVRW